MAILPRNGSQILLPSNVLACTAFVDRDSAAIHMICRFKPVAAKFQLGFFKLPKSSSEFVSRFGIIHKYMKLIVRDSTVHSTTMSSPTKDVYLVIGGSGFVGRHIVNALLARGDTVSIFDVVQRYHDVPFYTGDLTEEGSVSEALQKVTRIQNYLVTLTDEK